MSTARFYANTRFEAGDLLELDAEQSRHALKSRRLTKGSEVELINGMGGKALARLSVDSTPRKAVCELIDVYYSEKPSPELSIAVAVPKGDRQKFMVDMLSQLGVGEIVPLNCEHSVTQANQKTTERWRKTAIESCKQSGRVWLPVIGQERRPADLVRACHEAGAQVFVTDPEGEEGALLTFAGRGERNAVCLIGPEGGFSDTERTDILNLGATPVSLASHILRIETAAVAAASQWVAAFKQTPSG